MQLNEYLSSDIFPKKKHCLRAKYFLQDIVQSEKNPKTIFKILWLQYYILTCWQRKDYKHPYTEEEQRRQWHKTLTTNKEACDDAFVKIIRYGIRLFPTNLRRGKFKAYELPRLTEKSSESGTQVTTEPKSQSCCAS